MTPSAAHSLSSSSYLYFLLRPSSRPAMVRAVVSAPSSALLSHPSLPALSRHGRRRSLQPLHGPRRPDHRVRASLQQLPNLPPLEPLLARVEGLLYTLADAAVATDPSVSDAAVQKNGDWLSGIANGLESVLKVLKELLSTLHIPYSYGFAIILLTVIVKVVTIPLSMKQIESQVATQKLQPKLKAIEQRYAGDSNRINLEKSRLMQQTGVNPLAGCLPSLVSIPVWFALYRALSNVANEGLLTEGFFWIPSLGGPTTLPRQGGSGPSGISWLIPFVDGHPPLGWSDTAAYLVLPVLLIVFQYVLMELNKPPQTDDASKNSPLILKFLPLMIGYFSLSVPSGLTIYWFTNSLLSAAQQAWVKKKMGAESVVSKDGSVIINAGQAKRSFAQPVQTGDRFRQLKEQEKAKKLMAALPNDESEESDLDSDDSEEEESENKELYASSSSKQTPDYTRPKKGKRSKRKRTVQ